jgi:hypothetical protein
MHGSISLARCPPPDPALLSAALREAAHWLEEAAQDLERGEAPLPPFSPVRPPH